MPNPYDVERTWPDYFLEHRRLTVEQQGTYRCGELPVWTVYCPHGYLGNATIIEGDDGLIVYDTGVNMDAGQVIAAEIAKISDKPVVAVFYSHHHPDHYNGTRAIVDPADVESGAVKIYAWGNFDAERANEFGEILPRQSMGSAYYGGAFLSPDDKHHHGIGTVPSSGAAGFIPPTDLLPGNTTVTIARIRLEIFYTGGEAISEFGIHLPDLDMVLIADEFFTGLPNTHTIRGSKPRIAENYITALERVLDIEPLWLLGSHIMPIQGKQLIRDTVTRYRDATQYLWDQSIRLINKGYTPVELQHALKDVPEELIDPPYTVPMYGTPFTNVPEYFTGWVSWFSGDATDLFPSLPDHKARRMVELMGGVDAVVDAAKDDHSAGDHQLAAELTQLALRAAPDHEDARLLKAAALRARGYREVNPIARSWYLTGALELEKAFDPGDLLRSMLSQLGAAAAPAEIVRGWRYLLDADKAAGVDLTVGLKFTDSGEQITARIRHRVLVVDDGIAEDCDAVIELTAADLETGTRPTVVSGDATAWSTLLGLIDREITGFTMHMR
ncbi:MBL fold metallo-hydrolase [Rhodococcus sp. WB9]|uniref:alkyl sulfatase dimerization domain-containing protein n=1 Tax=Rhodococcus sp. WB9 TaxID=2594007 RepID=UPI0011870436|nr:alkyl sulfatase dimerization domain-containing protein [Rhodococcus sp. WB9]QDQ95296.1 MBL fold metallo-hydrolase [Rhodococcus sp. WB9]